MARHELNTDHDVFQLQVDGIKNCEIRLADRDFQVGDLLVLKETEFTGEQMKLQDYPLVYTGRTWEVEVVAMVHGEKYGLLPDHVLLLTKP